MTKASSSSKNTIYPLVSIVIANYNHGQHLQSAIESVLDQSCKDFELIVVDGASTDNSVDVIKRYEKYLGWWVSEEDDGQSHAFNKGFDKAKGEFLTWLNADDLLLPGTIKKLKAASVKNRECGWFTGNMVRFTDEDRLITGISWGPHILPDFYQEMVSYHSVFGPTSFFKKEIYDKIGPISDEYDYTMDTEYWARMYSRGYKQKRLNHFCWGFRLHHHSKTSEYGNIKLKKSERDKIRAEGKRVYEIYEIQKQPLHHLIGYLLRITDFSLIKLMLYKARYIGHNFHDLLSIMIEEENKKISSS